MKLGQMMLDGGKWGETQIVSETWAQKAVEPLVDLRGTQYGYQWWVVDYPYNGETVRGFFAGGNGGQIVMVVPALDLVISFWGGNYSDSALYIPQREYIPDYILPSVSPDP